MATTEHSPEFTVAVPPAAPRDSVSLSDVQRAGIQRMAEQMLLLETQRFVAGKRLAEYLGGERLHQLLVPLGKALEVAFDRLEKRPR
jgi:hypothetical protein